MKKRCLHDYKNAVQISPVDYMCPLCKELINPTEWLFMNNFKFVDVTPKKVKEKVIKKGIMGVALEPKSGKKVLIRKKLKD